MKLNQSQIPFLKYDVLQTKDNAAHHSGTFGQTTISSSKNHFQALMSFASSYMPREISHMPHQLILIMKIVYGFQRRMETTSKIIKPSAKISRRLEAE